MSLPQMWSGEPQQGSSVDSGIPFFKGKHTLALVKTGKRLCDSATPVVHQGKLPDSTLLELKTSFLLLVSNILDEHFTMLKSNHQESQ